ncbi:conjugal transfer protein TraB, partial [Vibrio parahaemolyticus]|nr:conjugal transfer protein TraB [Vibrio parahaemolyticus]
GGLIGLGIGAGTGKALPAVIGVFLAIFGVLGPTIVNALFTSATI